MGWVFNNALCYSGRVLPAKWVFGGKSLHDGIGFVVPVPNRARRTLEPEIIRHIAPGSMIHHDDWPSYRA